MSTGIYPTEGELKRIENWDYKDLLGLFRFMKVIWWMPEWGWREEVVGGEVLLFRLSTGGWSGNEDILAALKDNTLAWSIAWESERRGGHFEFEIAISATPPEDETPSST